MPFWVTALPSVVAVIGIAVAWHMYIRRPETPGRLAETHNDLYRLFLNKWYFDEVYDFMFVRSAKALGTMLWRGGDGRVIDGFGPDGVAQTVLRLAQRASRLQSGFVYHYAFAMLIGVAAFVSWYFYGLGG